MKQFERVLLCDPKVELKGKENDDTSQLDKSHDPVPITTGKTVRYGAGRAWARRDALQRLSKDYSLVANLYRFA